MTPNLKIAGAAPVGGRASTVVAYEVIGFLAIIALSWINELLGLPELIFATDHPGGWQESVLETAIILLVAVPVITLTRRLVSRLHYLEEFLRLCAWCRKIDMHGEWVPIEDFVQRTFDTQASHGICPTCRAEQRKSSGLKRAS
jgi:hypothetical protein